MGEGGERETPVVSGRRVRLRQRDLPIDRRELADHLSAIFTVNSADLNSFAATAKHANRIGDIETEVAARICYERAAWLSKPAGQMIRYRQHTVELMEANPRIELPPWANWLHNYTEARLSSVSGDYLRAHDLASAGVGYSRAHQLTEGEVASLSQLAWIGHAMGDDLGAVAAFNQAFELAGRDICPASFYAITTAAEVLADCGDHTGALTLFRAMADESVAGAYNVYDAMARGSVEAAAGLTAELSSTVVELEELVDNEEAQAHKIILDGVLSIQLGNHGEGMALLQTAVERTEGLSNSVLKTKAVTKLAEAQLNHDGPRAAFTTLSTVDTKTALATDRVKIRKIRAAAQGQLGNYREAWIDLKEESDLAPDNRIKVVRAIYHGPFGELLGFGHHPGSVAGDSADDLRRKMHDIRGTVSSILITSEMLGRMNDVDPTTVRSMSHASRRLVSQLDDLDPGIDLRDESGHRTYLDVVAQSVIDQYRPMAERDGIHLSLTASRPIATSTISAHDLHRVLSNLISNAIEHCSPGNTVKLEIAIVGHLARITVSDDGPGVPADLLASIFVQGKTETRRDVGRATNRGLGLAIVAQLVARAGGTYQATSDGPGTGLAITFALPYIPESDEGVR